MEMVWHPGEQTAHQNNKIALFPEKLIKVNDPLLSEIVRIKYL